MLNHLTLPRSFSAIFFFPFVVLWIRKHCTENSTHPLWKYIIKSFYFFTRGLSEKLLNFFYFLNFRLKNVIYCIAISNRFFYNRYFYIIQNTDRHKNEKKPRCIHLFFRCCKRKSAVLSCRKRDPAVYYTSLLKKW